MAEVFDVLRADHGDIQLLLAALEHSPGHAAGASQEVLRARKAAAERLVIDAARHEAAEQEYFWPAVRERLGRGNQLADEASAQEQEVSDALTRLGKLEAADDEFDGLLADLIPAVRRHLAFEEAQVWPQMRQALSPFQVRELGDQLSQAPEQAAERAARPQARGSAQPKGSARPKGRKVPESAEAAADKLNNAVSRRRPKG